MWCKNTFICSRGLSLSWEFSVHVGGMEKLSPQWMFVKKMEQRIIWGLSSIIWDSGLFVLLHGHYTLQWEKQSAIVDLRVENAIDRSPSIARLAKMQTIYL